MGKKTKEHRKRVAKRNANIKQQEKYIQKAWQEAFEKQMEVLKEKFETMSGDTMEELAGLLENEEHLQQENQQEESESVEPVQGE